MLRRLIMNNVLESRDSQNNIAYLVAPANQNIWQCSAKKISNIRRFYEITLKKCSGIPETILYPSYIIRTRRRDGCGWKFFPCQRHFLPSPCNPSRLLLLSSLPLRDYGRPIMAISLFVYIWFIICSSFLWFIIYTRRKPSSVCFLVGRN